MLLTLITALSLQVNAAVTAAVPVADSSLTTTTVQNYDGSSAYDREAETHLLEMANAERAHVGLQPLKMDEGLVRAARAHAAQMASQNKLSHQFSGEPAVPERIGSNSALHLNRTGENVAVAPNAEEAHVGLMASPPHRHNLLSPNFNVAGFGVFRSGHWLYVTQDFGSSAPAYSVQQAQAAVSSSLEQLRAQARMPRLQRVVDRSAQTSACAMAQADSLTGAEPVSGSYIAALYQHEAGSTSFEHFQDHCSAQASNLLRRHLLREDAEVSEWGVLGGTGILLKRTRKVIGP